MNTWTTGGADLGHVIVERANSKRNDADWIKSPSKRSSVDDRTERPVEEHEKVIVLRLELRDGDTKVKREIFRKVSAIRGVTSISFDEKGHIITVIGLADMDSREVPFRLRKYRPKVLNFETLEAEDKKWVTAEEYHPMSKPTSWKSEGTGDYHHEIQDPRKGIPIVAGTSTTTAPNVTNSNYDWHSCNFLSNRMPPLTPSGCSADDVTDFLPTQQVSGSGQALVDKLSTMIQAYSVKPEKNPFHRRAVSKSIREARQMTRPEEYILVFSCTDNLDLEETYLIESISRELRKRDVTPLTYNLSDRENLDTNILYGSSIGIMILTDNYVCSRQSLDHLAAIMEYWKMTDLVIIPIYFKVSLSDICGLKSRSEAASLQLQNVEKERIQKWKAAVTEIVSIGGIECTKGTRYMIAEKVVRNACLRLYLKNGKNLKGILALLRNSQPSGVEIVGIWGMAGIGKRSLAREAYEILARQYDLCYFLDDFHLKCQMKGPRQMRDDFFSKVFGEEKPSVGACDTKLSFMREWFQKKTILVVLDDVSNARDAEAVVGGFGWFSHGHRIILTSRRKQVLVECKVKVLYEIHKLCEFESSRLCQQYLHVGSAVISELLSCSSGIPLALKVLASSISKHPTNVMKKHLQGLRRNPPIEIQEAFRRSFDGLDENEKNIFLDLACFFRGENKDYVVQILDACGFFTYLGICDLIDESLISLLDNRIEMPVPFQDMGRFIVRGEDEDPCERSRLWDSNDIADVLTNNSGTEAIEGIFLDVSDLVCELCPTVFSKMYRLRLLKFYCSTSGNQCKLSLPRGLDTLPDELRLLHWEYYPLEYLPQKFNTENLVEINMPYSSLTELWEGKKKLEKLKKIRLSHSRKLTKILVLAEALNLEHIDLEGCTSLVDVSSSIPRGGKLISLNMKDCSHLQSLPPMTDLTYLELLNLSGCLELEHIPDLAPDTDELHRRLIVSQRSDLCSSDQVLRPYDTLDMDEDEDEDEDIFEDDFRFSNYKSSILRFRARFRARVVEARRLRLRLREFAETGDCG